MCTRCGVSVATPPPSERVALILGRDELDEDDDHHTHEIFCELEELRLPGEDGELEWKETARCHIYCNFDITSVTIKIIK